MALIRLSQTTEEDIYTYLEDDAPLASGQAVIVSQKRFLSELDAVRNHNAAVGVQIGPEDDPRDLLEYFSQISLLAVHFPIFADGRGYSHARLLRERYGWEGELRATGQVLRDQLFFMRRCGFDAFELAPGRDEKDARKAFDEFNVTYQAAADGRAPIYLQNAEESL